MSMTITHKTIQHRIDLYLERMGWIKQRNKRKNQGSPRSDGIYKHKGIDFTLLVEVKPTLSTKDEIYRGMGQAIQWLPNKTIRSILIIPERYIGMVQPIFRDFDEHIGLIGYDDNFTFSPVKNVWDVKCEEQEDLSWLEEPEQQALHPNINKDVTLVCQECEHQWKAKKRRRLDTRRLCPRCQKRNVALYRNISFTKNTKHHTE